jgi:hypothetical protein
MSDPAIIALSTLIAVLLFGVLSIYVLITVRRMSAEHNQKLHAATTTLHEAQSMQRDLTDVVRRIESDSHMLQQIAMQIEDAMAAVNHSMSAVAVGAAERQAAAIDSLRDYLDAQERQLATTLEAIRETPQTQHVHPRRSLAEKTSDSYDSRFRREFLQDPEKRFSVLKDWLSINALAILHRASRTWKTAHDLIVNVPAYLQPEAELLEGCVLVIGTRNYPEKLALPLRQLQAASPFAAWFETSGSGRLSSNAPAVLMPVNGHFKLVEKGTQSGTLPC